MPRLVLLRHGQSEWNLANRFTGWVDVDLTANGEDQARLAGQLMREAGFTPACGYASLLKRAIRTLCIALNTMDRVWIPVHKHWRLNERHYGALTGMDKEEVAARHGDEQVKIWRRSYDIAPPPLAADDERHPRFDPRYAALDPALLPDTESLKTALARVEPYWRTEIAPRLAAGEDVLVAAHGNSLRALIKILFAVPDTDINLVEVPTGNPMLIELDAAGAAPRAARFLDEARAQSLPPLP
ncbi:MAG: 2,3-diphosphoglycerate-dependent phosphoglycerate mutase [Maricaulaceae bacterium]|nr:2,3-diphosphoglycerate-dependent phosphoglycerate mutase [Maricaulaceae bacterium]